MLNRVIEPALGPPGSSRIGSGAGFAALECTYAAATRIFRPLGRERS
jgi:hypothetical protein